MFERVFKLEQRNQRMKPEPENPGNDVFARFSAAEKYYKNHQDQLKIEIARVEALPETDFTPRGHPELARVAGGLKRGYLSNLCSFLVSDSSEIDTDDSDDGGENL